MKFKLVYILHIFIVAIFIATIIINVWDFNRILKLVGVPISEVCTSYIFEKLFYITFPMIAMLGVFIKKPKGWFMITQYLCFIFFNALIEVYNEQEVIGIESVIIFIVILSFIALSNHPKITNFYKFKSFSVLRDNLIATVIGFGIGMIFLVLKN